MSAAFLLVFLATYSFHAHAFTITEAANVTLDNGTLLNLEQVYTIPTHTVVPFIDVQSKKQANKPVCAYQFIVSVMPVWNVKKTSPEPNSKPESFLKLSPSVHPEHSRMMRFKHQEFVKRGRKCSSPADIIQSGKRFSGEFIGGETVLNSQIKVDFQGASVLARMKIRENGTFGISSLSALKRKTQIETLSRPNSIKIASQKTQVR